VIIALIPARSGSKRVPGKNVRELAGHPLLAYTIQVAKDSGLFGEHIYVSSDSDEYLAIAEKYGARPLNRIGGGDDESDSAWISQAFYEIHRYWDCSVIERYFILRPTSPFRSKYMLERACLLSGGLNLKAVELTKQRPEKMWRNGRPFIPGGYHLEQSSTFEPLFVQNGALEIRQNKHIPLDGPIVQFHTEGYEGFDINTEEDWILAEALIERGLAKLPEIK